MTVKEKIASIITTLFVWGLAGALFGALFGGLHALLSSLGLVGWVPLVAAAAVAATTTSAFYSAMPVALVGAMAGILASIGYLIVVGPVVELLGIAGIAGLGGVLAGLFYAWMVPGGGRPLAEVLSGLLAGLFAGGCLALTLAILGRDLDVLFMAAGVVALVGTFFQISERWLVGHCARWFPALISAAVVSGLIAAVVGSSVWIIGGAASVMLESQAGEVSNRILGAVPLGFLGGLFGGAVTGILLQILGFRIGPSS